MKGQFYIPTARITWKKNETAEIFRKCRPQVIENTADSLLPLTVHVCESGHRYYALTQIYPKLKAHMKNVLDFKAIGLGLVAFVVAQLLISQVLSRFITPEVFRWIVEHAAWSSWVNEIFAPGVAGFVSAWTARSHRIINGMIGGTLVVVLIIIWFIPFIEQFLSWGVPLIAVTFYSLMAFLGAALGSYLRGKRGA